jgi:anti-sigma B factor antagonist
MFEIEYGKDGAVMCCGRLDAAQCNKAEGFLAGLEGANTLDFTDLEYISSAGLGILLKTQKRLVAEGAGLKIINVNNHIHDVFRYSGFHTIFEITARE